MLVRSLAVVLSLALPTLATAAERSPDEEADRIYSYCFEGGGSMAQGRACLVKQEERVSRELGAAIRKKKFEIGEVANRSPDGEPPHGADTAQRWKVAFTKEQAAWAAYSKLTCQALLDFGTGTAGAEDDAGMCRLRTNLRRIKDLR
ncbi:lysozyme inhibitor LprI family protein [Methylobacterium sp. CM6247]